MVFIIGYSEFKCGDTRAVRKKVCLITTVEMPVKSFLLNHIRALEKVYEVSVVVNTDNKHFLVPMGVAATVYPVAIQRKISPLRDLVALVHLAALFRRRRFDIVHSMLPKAGLLAMMAGMIAGVPHRIHSFTGQVWAARRGFQKWLLKLTDKITVVSSTGILVDGHIQRRFIVNEGIVAAGQAHILANGSMCGVDVKRFCPNPGVRADIRKRLGISNKDIVFLYLGRLNRDKGVIFLAHAFARLSEKTSDARLLVVGPDEEGVKPKMLEVLKHCLDRVHFEDYTDRPEDFFAAADVMCLPSYREGFPTSIIEASAVGIPTIGTKIYGIEDAIIDGETGLLFEVENVNALFERLMAMINRPDLRTSLGQKAQARALRDFSSDKVVGALLDYYRTSLEESR